MWLGDRPAHVQWPCSGDGDKSHSMMLSPVGKGHLLPLTVVHNMEVVLRVTFRDILRVIQVGTVDPPEHDYEYFI